MRTRRAGIPRGTVSAALRPGRARVVFGGHEHTFQHSHHDGIDYFVAGAGSELRKGFPDRDRFGEAHTRSCSDRARFLLVTVDGQPRDLRRWAPGGTPVLDDILKRP